MGLQGRGRLEEQQKLQTCTYSQPLLLPDRVQGAPTVFGS